MEKHQFPVMLQRTLVTITKETIKNGLRKCGLYPFYESTIEVRPPSCKTSEPHVFGNLSMSELRHHLHFLEFVIRKSKIQLFVFKSNGCDIENTGRHTGSLLWKKGAY